MAKPKGSAKTGGRTKGTPNKRTEVLRSITEALGIDVPMRLAALLPQLDPAKQADVLMDLMGYLYPKRRAVEHSGPEGGPIEIVARRDEICRLLNDPESLAAMETLEARLEQSANSES